MAVSQYLFRLFFHLFLSCLFCLDCLRVTDGGLPGMSEKKTNGGGSAMAAGAVINGPRGRLTAGSELTEKQQSFVLNISKGLGLSESAKLAGYATPHLDAWRNMRNPAIVAEIRQRQTSQISGDLSGVAMATLRAVMTDETAPAAARVSAAKWTLEAAGHGLAAALGSARLGLDSSEKPLSALTISELEEMAASAAASVESIKRAAGSVVEV